MPELKTNKQFMNLKMLIGRVRLNLLLLLSKVKETDDSSTVKTVNEVLYTV